MGEFVLTGSDVFGMYCRIEQKRFGVPNEMNLYKVVSSLRSNRWCEVPYREASNEVIHNSMEDCVLAIRCGIDETKVQRFRMEDVEFLHQEIEPEQERTCRNMSDDKRGFTCSECGTHVRCGSCCHSYVDDAGTRWYTTADKTGWNYCPNCGRRVVEEIGSGL